MKSLLILNEFDKISVNSHLDKQSFKLNLLKSDLNGTYIEPVKFDPTL